jgi:eukaryotic-like serine/threonine-protein kinase
VQDEGQKGTDVRRPDDGATVMAPHGPASTAMRAAPVTGERIGKYVVERTIGRGGMGVVVAARHEQLDERVAIKVLHPKAAKDAVQRERFVREARSIVRIKSEHVVRVLDAGVEEGTGAPFIVMEHLEGLDLGQVLSQNGSMPVPMAVDCIIQICEAVAAAHALGIIHRDLKPSNFFLTRRPDGTPLVKVLDFGISKAAAEEGAPDPRLTETQAVFGSPTYMSPEQIRSSKNVDARSDVWSLGVALFELLTGKLPFIADNVAGLLASVIADAPFRVTTFVHEVPVELEAVVLGCLEKDPARRIGSALELAARLMPFASPDGAHLAARMDRIARGIMGSTQSFPPPPPLSGSGGFPAPSNRGSAPFPPVAFGTTGTDLSATGPSALRASRNTARTVGIVFAVVATIAVVIGGTVGVVTLRDRGRAQAAKAAETNAASASPPPPETTTMPVVASSAPLSATPPSPTASAAIPTPGSKRGKPGHAGRTGGGVAGPASAPPGAAAAPPSPAAAPAPAPSANLDSRF